VAVAVVASGIAAAPLEVADMVDIAYIVVEVACLVRSVAADWDIVCIVMVIGPIVVAASLVLMVVASSFVAAAVVAVGVAMDHSTTWMFFSLL
jgi:hypothetical protein